MKELIQRFYQSIQGETPVPVPYREIILTARLMDQIFAQIYVDKEAQECHNEVDRVHSDGRLPLARGGNH